MTSLFNPAFTPLIANLATAFLTAAFESAVLVTATALALKFLAAIPASTRSRIWALVFLATLLLPVFNLATPPPLSTPLPSHPSQLHLTYIWAAALIAAWFALSVYRAIHLFLSALRLRQIVSRSIPISPDPDLAPLLCLSHISLPVGSGISTVAPSTEASSRPERSGVERPPHFALAFSSHRGRTVRLCTSTDVSVPSVAGFFHPRILLPPALLADLSPTDLRQIVLHEMEHLRRADDWTNLVQKLGLVLFPLNPALLWVERRLCLERELACDDAVLLSTGTAKAYATCLANLAEHSILRRGLSLALGAWQRQSELTRRVHRILRAKAAPTPASRWSLAASTVMLVAVVSGGAALTRTPQLISFSPMPSPSIAVASTPPTSATRTFSNPRSVLVSSITPERHSTNVPSADASAGDGESLSSFAEGGESAFVSNPAGIHRSRARHTKQPTPAAQFRTVSNAAPRRAAPAPHIILTTWDPPPEDQPHIVFAVSQDSQFTFAYVPVPDGWLLIQL